MRTNRLLTEIIGPLLGVAILMGACTADSPGQSSGSPDGSPDGTPGESAEEPPTSGSLLYTDGRKLMRYDVGSGEREQLAKLPSTDIQVSPDGSRYVVVKETARSSNRKAFVKPRLRLADVDGSGKSTDLGPGSTPVWSPDGTRVAAVLGAAGFICGSDVRIGGGGDAPEGCVEAEQIVSFPADRGRGKARVVLGPTKDWSLLGFTDGNRVGAVVEDRAVVISAPRGRGDPLPLGFDASEVWGVSPVGLRLLVVQEEATFFTVPGEGAGPPLVLNGATLGEGAWAPDGNRVAAVLLEPGADSGPLGVIDVATNEIEMVPDGDGALGDVVWGLNGSFAYVRTDPDRPDENQAVVCTEELSCAELFTFTKGMSLLALPEESGA